jgi:hypothetical protein
MTSHGMNPAGSPNDRLPVIREWLWRHSSQPNGDPWDSDPEHLNHTAQTLLHDLARWFPSTDRSPRASAPDTGPTQDRRQAHPPAPTLPASPTALPVPRPTSGGRRAPEPARRTGR